MKKTSLIRAYAAPALVGLLPFALSLICYSRLPGSIAVHFDSQGLPDKFVSRPTAAFGVPAMLLAVYIAAIFMMHADPKRKGIPQGVRALIVWIIPLLSAVTHGLTIAYALGIAVNIGFVVTLMTGLLLVVLGNLLPKCRQNYTVGIRLPWTLHSESNWRFTHRISGFVYVLGGLVMAANAFAGLPWIAYGVLAALAVTPVAVSYGYARRRGAGADVEEEV